MATKEEKPKPKRPACDVCCALEGEACIYAAPAGMRYYGASRPVNHVRRFLP